MQPNHWRHSPSPSRISNDICHEESLHELVRRSLGVVYVERTCAFVVVCDGGCDAADDDDADDDADNAAADGDDDDEDTDDDSG